MRVALDATPLTLTSGGLARYTRELFSALARVFPEDQYLLCGRPQPPRSLLERRWWLWGVEREMARRRAALFHGTNFEVPYLARRPSVLTLHDLSPWMNPAWHRRAGRIRARTPLLIGLGIATMIVTPSEAVRRQALERFRIPPARIVAVPHGGLAQSRGSDRRGSYFLYVGTLEPRKNIEGLLEAWREVRRGHPVDLVLAGSRREDFPPLAEEQGLRMLGEVADEALPALYAEALALVYPSHYEGFGMPLVEAMQCGACVIASRDPALEETAGGAAIHAAGTADLAAAMRAVVERPEFAAAWRDRALRRGLEFSWERTARLTREVYCEALARW